jgi:hypothetical protein
MMNPIHRFNVWFDTLKEPKRLVIFILLAFGFLLPLSAAQFLSGLKTFPSGKSTAPEALIFGTIGAVWMMFAALIAYTRTVRK